MRATRVPPIAAVREGAALERARAGAAPIAGAVLLVVAAALLGYARSTGNRLGSGSSLLALAVGALRADLGHGRLSRRGSSPALATVVGCPARSLRRRRRPARRENAVRNPAAHGLDRGGADDRPRARLVRRRARQGRARLDEQRDARAGQRRLGRHARRTAGRRFPAAGRRRGREGAGRDALDVDPRRPRPDGKTQVNVDGVDPKTVAGLYNFKWKRGSSTRRSRARRRRRSREASFAKSNDLTLGDAFMLRTPAGKPMHLHVVGVFQPPTLYELLGGVVVCQQAFDRDFAAAAEPVHADRRHVVAGRARAGARAFPDTKVRDRGRVREEPVVLDSTC